MKESIVEKSTSRKYNFIIHQSHTGRMTIIIKCIVSIASVNTLLFEYSISMRIGRGLGCYITLIK
jgi:hypothetical protein